MNAHISIKLFATLGKFAPQNADQHPISAGMTVRDLMHQIEIAPEKVKLIFINGVRANSDSTLHDRDRVGLFPPVGGG